MAVALPIAGMVAGCLVTALLAIWIVPRAPAPAVIGGMLGPLVAVVVSWAIVARAHRRDPASVTSRLMAMFAAKMVFFGVWIVVMIRVVGVAPMPFIVSFTAYFVALYGVEAVLLQRLSRTGRRTSERPTIG